MLGVVPPKGLGTPVHQCLIAPHRMGSLAHSSTGLETPMAKRESSQWGVTGVCCRQPSHGGLLRGHEWDLTKPNVVIIANILSYN